MSEDGGGDDQNGSNGRDGEDEGSDNGDDKDQDSDYRDDGDQDSDNGDDKDQDSNYRDDGDQDSNYRDDGDQDSNNGGSEDQDSDSGDSEGPCSDNGGNQDQGSEQAPTVRAEWGPDTAQDSLMLAYGFFVNTKWGLAICMACRTSVAANELYGHLKKDLKELGLSASRSYCDSVIKTYSLRRRDKVKLPTSAIPAIHGLPVKSNMECCGGCGYAAQTRSSILRHQNGKCKDSGIHCGHAQTFFPRTNRDYFAVKTAPAKAPKPDGPTPVSTQFKALFSGLPSNSLITVPSNTRDMNHFLTLGNWFQEVDGLTGREAHGITRDSLPVLRTLVRESVNLYVTAMNTELRGEDPAVKIAMGDYNK